jgi:hypothetical protein
MQSLLAVNTSFKPVGSAQAGRASHRAFFSLAADSRHQLSSSQIGASASVPHLHVLPSLFFAVPSLFVQRSGELPGCAAHAPVALLHDMVAPHRSVTLLSEFLVHQHGSSLLPSSHSFALLQRFALSVETMSSPAHQFSSSQITVSAVACLQLHFSPAVVWKFCVEPSVLTQSS